MFCGLAREQKHNYKALLNKALLMIINEIDSDKNT
jgi:hypothetical protein